MITVRTPYPWSRATVAASGKLSIARISCLTVCGLVLALPLTMSGKPSVEASW